MRERQVIFRDNRMAALPQSRQGFEHAQQSILSYDSMTFHAGVRSVFGVIF